MMPAQNLPSLKTAPEITVGKLPNGLSYYLAANTASKGLADFSLVQKGRIDNDASREALSNLPHFTKVTPYEFLASKGVGYGRDGYVTTTREATIFRFDKVPVFEANALDSTLMVVFDIVEKYPGEQAIIICGDINSAEVLKKIQVFSLMVPGRVPSPPEEEYRWEPVDTMTFGFIRTPQAEAGYVTAMYQFPRTPRNRMNTAQPLVSEMFASEFGTILKNRLQRRFREQDIPLSDIRYVYRGSSDGPGDDHYTITVHTSGDSLKAAARVLGETLAELDVQGVSKEEHLEAKQVMTNSLRKAAGAAIPNSTYVQRCISAYLYGSDLASLETRGDFFSSRDISTDRETGLLNNFISALLDKDANLTLQCVGSYPGLLAGSALKKAFRDGWDEGVRGADKYLVKVNYGDTLGLFNPVEKAKLKTVMDDQVSGGEIWTFSNGVKVIFKKLPTNRQLYYALMVRGGYSTISSLKRGEGAFVSDMLPLYDVGGLKGQDFGKMLEGNGITMDYEVSLSDMRITGSAPSGKLQLLMKSLFSLANERSLNQESFNYYKRCEALREEREKGGNRGILTTVDSLMCPDYMYSSYRKVENLGDDLPQRAEEYFERQFSRINDGVLVIMGDCDPVQLKKLLTRYIGSFRTNGKGFVARPKIQYNPPVGTRTFICGLETLPDVYEGSVNISSCAEVPFSTDKYTAFKIAGIALEKSLINALARTGQYVTVTDGFSTYPRESMEILIRCRQADSYGIPAGIDPADPADVLDRARFAIRQVSSQPLGQTELNAYKGLLQNNIASQLARPEDLMDMVLFRYSEGKDLVSKYKERINSVTAADVQAVMEAIASGTTVEYVIH